MTEQHLRKYASVMDYLHPLRSMPSLGAQKKIIASASMTDFPVAANAEHCMMGTPIIGKLHMALASNGTFRHRADMPLVMSCSW